MQAESEAKARLGSHSETPLPCQDYPQRKPKDRQKPCFWLRRKSQTSP